MEVKYYLRDFYIFIFCAITAILLAESIIFSGSNDVDLVERIFGYIYFIIPFFTLSLSTQELFEKIQNELIDNPMLEEINNLEKSKVPEVYSVAEVKKMEVRESIKNSDVSWQETYSIDGPAYYDNEASNRNQKMIESSPLNVKLSEYLYNQLRLTNLNEKELSISEILISMIDEKGFITYSPVDLSKELNIHLKITLMMNLDVFIYHTC